MFSLSPPAGAGTAPAPELALAGTGFELRFDSLFVEGRGFSFPCDEQGLVQIDALSARARDNYFYARAVVGREFRTPAIRCRAVG
jgi:hypothetical protein